MPKETVPAFTSRMLEKYPSELGIDANSNLICVPCNDGRIIGCTLFQVKQHLRSGKHKRNISDAKEVSITDSVAEESHQLHRDLFKMLQNAKIPLSKIYNRSFACFIEKYTAQPLPASCHTCGFAMYKKCIEELQLKASNAYIWVSVNETTDAKHRNIVNFVFGILGKREEYGKSYLLNCDILAKLNADTISTFFTNSLQLIWPKGLNYDKVFLVTTDAAPYTYDAMSKLADMFPKMIHVKCLACDLQQISECVRMNSADVEVLISRVAFVFRETPWHRHQFREIKTYISSPPTSTQFTQRSTWIEAAIYYANNFSIIESIVDRIDKNDSDAINRARNAFLSPTVKANLAFIKAHFNYFVEAIDKIQKRGTPLAESIYLIDQVCTPIADMKFPSFRNEFHRLLDENPGYEKLKSINLILNGVLTTSDGLNVYEPADLTMYAMAPITLCDVQRAFPAYESVLNDQDVPFKQIKEHLIVYCNDF